MSITYRSVKGSELEHAEVDENFRYLDEKSIQYIVGHKYRGPVVRIYDNKLYRLVDSVDFPYTATNFLDELANGDWILITGFSDEILSNFVKKSFSAHFAFNGSGVDTSIPLNPNGYSEIRVTNPALESIAGIDLTLISGNPSAEVPYTGKMYLLKNITGNAITIKHNSAISDIPFYTNDEQNLEVPNKGIIIFTYDNAACEILLTNFSVGTANDFPHTEITKTELDILITNSELTKGFYKISGVNPTLYGGTTILVEVLEDNKLPIDAYGLFYNPKYDKTIDGYGVAKDYAIWKDESEQLESGVYTIGENKIWGGKHWICIAPTNINTKYIVDKFNLSTDYFEEVPFDNIDYNLVLDKIKYDYEHDLIIERNEGNSNIVSFNYDSLKELSSEITEDLVLDNPIKSFQWGNLYDYDFQRGIGNNKVYDSLNENINFTGAYQINLNFDTNGKQTNVNFGSKSHQNGLIFKNQSSQSYLTFGNDSSQTNLIFKNQSSQSYLTFGNDSSQTNLIFKNQSSQNYLTFGNSSSQNNLTFNNKSAQSYLVLNDGISQNNLVFNRHQRSGITIYEIESELTFDSNKQATKLTGNQFFTGKTTNDFAQMGDIYDLGAVAFSNDYNDLGNKPNIPTLTSQLTNDSGFITNVITALGYTPENSVNKSTSVTTDSASNTKYPSVKAVFDYLQPELNSRLKSYAYDSVSEFPMAIQPDAFFIDRELGDVYIGWLDPNSLGDPGLGGASYKNISLQLGITDSTAYRGDRGKTAYDHSQATGNPHNTTKSDIGLGNVDNTSDLNKPISNATQNALNSKLSIESPSTTGTAISFTADKVYGTLTTPETGNITADVTNAKLGVTNIIIHNSGTAPTFDSKFKKLSGSGNYVTGVINYIYCTYISATEIIYSINQRA